MHDLDTVVRGVDARAVAAGRRAGLILAAVGSGLAVACLSTTASLDRDLLVDGATRFGPGFAIAVGALFVLAWWGGGHLARSRHEPRLFICVLGAVFAEIVVLVAALIGAASSLLLERQPFVFGVAVALVDGIAKPIYWTALLGSLPAFALGAAFPRTARHCIGVGLSRKKP